MLDNFVITQRRQKEEQRNWEYNEMVRQKNAKGRQVGVS